jgi:hypothetical protein
MVAWDIAGKISWTEGAEKSERTEKTERELLA